MPIHTAGNFVTTDKNLVCVSINRPIYTAGNVVMTDKNLVCVSINRPIYTAGNVVKTDKNLISRPVIENYRLAKIKVFL